MNSKGSRRLKRNPILHRQSRNHETAECMHPNPQTTQHPQSRQAFSSTAGAAEQSGNAGGFHTHNCTTLHSNLVRQEIVFVFVHPLKIQYPSISLALQRTSHIVQVHAVLFIYHQPKYKAWVEHWAEGMAQPLFWGSLFLCDTV